MLRMTHSPGALFGTDVGAGHPNVLNGVTHVGDEKGECQSVEGNYNG